MGSFSVHSGGAHISPIQVVGDAILHKLNAQSKCRVAIEGPFAAGKDWVQHRLEQFIIGQGISREIIFKLGMDEVLLPREGIGSREEMQETAPERWRNNMEWYRFPLLLDTLSRISVASAGNEVLFENLYKEGTIGHNKLFKIAEDGKWVGFFNGIYVLMPEFRRYFDLIVYVHAPFTVRFQRQFDRASARGYEVTTFEVFPSTKLGEAILGVYEPTYNRYLSEFYPFDCVQFFIDNSGLGDPMLMKESVVKNFTSSRSFLAEIPRGEK